MNSPIVIALGANVSSRWGSPRRTLEAALAALGAAGVKVLRHSAWYRSAPIPPSAQAPYLNGVALVETSLTPGALLAVLHRIERRFGRVRRRPNEPRTLDLDLIDYRGRVDQGGHGRPVLPHPRAAGRAFVLQPLAEIASPWHYPGVRAVPLGHHACTRTNRRAPTGSKRLRLRSKAEIPK